MRQKRDYDETLSAFDVLADKTMQDDLVSRLRDADRNSVQRSLGSGIFGEAVDRITALEASLAAARRDALEEAARVAEKAARLCEPNTPDGSVAWEIVIAIRALMENSNAKPE